MLLNRHFLLFLCCLFALNTLANTTPQINRVEPPFWWAGMSHPNLQLMVHGEQISNLHVKLDYPGVRIDKISKVQNPNYLFVDLILEANVVAGKFEIQFLKESTVVHRYTYELKTRESESAQRKGFDQTDVLYLITPDRFVNGDPQNDEIASMEDKLDRSAEYGRHGGDIKGIADNLAYIRDMGFTAIWLNPVLENDQPQYSYHGYSTTDYYKVDPRFGSNEAYQQLSKQASKMGIKIIMDLIANHCGSEHWWMKDLPCSDWLNYQKSDVDNYTFTNHRKSSILDPHVAAIDRQLMVDGWFVKTMPDLNQRNQLLSNYLIQNTIWWIEFAGLAGIRQDTYSYPHKEFMTDWTCRIMEEYPHFNIVGEEWTENPNIVAYWQEGKQNADGYTSCLPSIMDFPLQSMMSKAITEPETWGTGWKRLYEALANDFIYANPDNLVVFPDNHDMSRIYTQMNHDYGLYQLALAYVLTTRGIPQLYYGTEILMANPSSTSHGIIRSDFPGGWPSDTINAFKDIGLSEQQLKAKDFIKRLLNWRKSQPIIHHGKLIHYEPKNGVYVYFRFENEDERVMVILNKNENPMSINCKQFAQMTEGFSTGKNVLSGNIIKLSEPIILAPKSPLILEIKK